MKEYTIAEQQTYHVRHFCCFECDKPLAGLEYVAIENQPVCLTCYQVKYGKVRILEQCASCASILLFIVVSFRNVKLVAITLWLAKVELDGKI